MSAIIRQARTRIGAPDQQTSEVFSRPACTGGVNALSPLMGMPETDCIYTFNMMPVEYGMRLRKGYTEWAINATGDVRTVVPYESANSGQDRLWGATENGLYNITAEGETAPALDLAFPTQNDAAGFCVHVEWVTDANVKYLFLADETNGLYQYTEGVGWARPTGWTYNPDGTSAGTAVPYADVVFITVHKQRLWFILRNGTAAFYSAPAAISGDFTRFTFGAKMTRGGDLRGLYTWSIDGGDGIDDYMLAIGRGGDLLVYRGYDPASAATWELTGAWFIGETPESRKLVSEYGSEIYILSVFGLTNLRDLLQGADAADLRQSPSAKVNRFLRADVQMTKARYGWAIEDNQADGFMQVIPPKPTSGEYYHYNQNLNTRAWGFWESVPAICAQSWNGDYFLGAADGVVYVYDGEYDGATIAGDTGAPVNFRLLTSFAPLGPHATNTAVGFLRALGILTNAVAVNMQPVYDYAVDASLLAPGPVADAGVSLWDVAKWDENLWVGGPTAGSLPVSTLGQGRVAAIAMSGNAADRINILGWDGIYEKGGPL